MVDAAEAAAAGTSETPVPNLALLLAKANYLEASLDAMSKRIKMLSQDRGRGFGMEFASITVGDGLSGHLLPSPLRSIKPLHPDPLLPPNLLLADSSYEASQLPENVHANRYRWVL